jgi:PAS domain S-box-containing protein
MQTRGEVAMFDIGDSSIDSAIIITDYNGNIRERNCAANLLIQQCSPDVEMAQTIFQIDPGFNLKNISNCPRQQIQVGSFTKVVNVFPIKHKKYGANLLFIFETASSLGDMNFNSVMNYIDDAIIITNRQHVVEEANEAFQRLTGVESTFCKGKVMEDLVQEKVLNESVSLLVFKLKALQTATIKYSTGKILTWTAAPVFNNAGEIEWVIGTGRDISALVDLEARLHKAETLNTKYYNKLKIIEDSLNKTGIVYSSSEMNTVIDIATKAAKFDSPVFIWGASGVGKELIAHLIHNASPRKNMPFIAINCAAIPSELLESELFGYTEGAFTGAQKGGKKGLFQEANGGTIFLDEIGEMPVSMQSKLLRVLQTNELMNIGGNKNIGINVRVISSTNLSKDDLENNTHFRQDLYYRLNVIPIYVPALRERRDDIPALVDHFLKIFNLKGDTNKKLSGRLLRRLYNYEWPGNIRELKNVVERLVIFSESDEIGEDEIYALNFDKKRGPIIPNDDISLERIMPMKMAIQKIQEILIKKTIDKYGSITKAAKVLEINPVTIHRIKKKMDCTIQMGVSKKI